MVKKQKKNKYFIASLGLSLLFLQGGCANTNGNVVTKGDPYEEVNRSIFNFNKDLDLYVGNPVSSAYDYITPDLVQMGIGNFFSNLKDINVVLNDLMQGKFLQAGQDTSRFLLNTTAGLAGIFDVAT
ncbi:MAG: VacJ family lipoprotein, partial [Methylococcales bacterium]|nr:VacJ family lipoprotein [Methylococcales bacterium]